jgi:hypothetical protein
MSAGKFTLSYPARVQISRLTKADKTAIANVFASDRVKTSPNTKIATGGRFVTRVGAKRVLWAPKLNDQPEILSIVDRSFLSKAE